MSEGLEMWDKSWQATRNIDNAKKCRAIIAGEYDLTINDLKNAWVSGIDWKDAFIKAVFLRRINAVGEK